MGAIGSLLVVLVACRPYVAVVVVAPRIATLPGVVPGLAEGVGVIEKVGVDVGPLVDAITVLTGSIGFFVIPKLDRLMAQTDPPRIINVPAIATANNGCGSRFFIDRISNS